MFVDVINLQCVGKTVFHAKCYCSLYKLITNEREVKVGKKYQNDVCYN